MKGFDYVRAASAEDARGQAVAGARLLAGGTTLLDLMKCNVERPNRLIDISHLAGLDGIDVDERRVRIGGLARMSQVADHEAIRREAPAVSESLWRAASAQIRNMATIGGNLMQRIRCTYSVMRRATRIVISGFRAPAARRYRGCTAITRSSAEAMPVSRHIQAISPSRWLPSMPS